MLQTISNNLSVATNGKTGAFLSFVGHDQAHTPVVGWYDTSEALYPDHYPWGLRDDKPNQMHKLMSANDKALQLLRTQTKYIVGGGVGAFRKIVENRKTIYEPYETHELQDWMEAAEVQDFFKALAWQWSFSWNSFANISLSYQAGRFFARPTVRDLFTIRAGRILAGESRIQRFFLSDKFATPYYNAAPKIAVPAFDPAFPTAFAESIMHVKEPIPGQPFYAFAGWWGGEKWLEVSNLIPQFHISGLKNGYNIKYMIKIPVDYFIQQGIIEEDAQRAAFATLQSNFDKWLSGVNNVNKALITRYFMDSTGKQVSGIIIEPLNNPLSDEAYTRVSTTADVAHASSHGILPSLAGIDTGSKLGGSGSELRLAYDYAKMMTATDRQAQIKPILAAARISGVLPRDVTFQVIDAQMTTLDANPTGTQNVITPNQ
ncbi:hypothetical protein [Runella sp.]|uniref:hypothetical protein n=1 Tax=Runella sp. TaxID=1960881 RepID=UPI003D0A11B7